MAADFDIDFVAFQTLTAAEMDTMADNDRALKDWSAYANDSFPIALIADGTLTNAKLATGAGQPGGAWDSWSPSYTNVTVGNGTVVAKYKQVGKTITGEFSLTFGNTTSFSGEVSIGVPVTAARASRNVGVANILDTGAANKPGVAILSDTSNFKVYVVTGTNDTRMNLVSNTVPQSWTTGDILTFNFIYEAA